MLEKHPASHRMAKPHDHYFKSVESILEVALELVQVGLPPEIYAQLQIETLKLTSTTFVDEALEEHLSDLIYTCGLKNSDKNVRICLLFEHKRKVSSRELVVQLIQYILKILEEDLRQGRAFSLPLPIVIYNGEAVWIPQFLRDFFTELPEIFRRYLLDFEFEVINLQALSDENILSLYDSLLVRNIFLAMKHAFDDEFYKNNFSNLFIFASENVRPTVIEMLVNLTTSYIIYVSGLKKKDIMQVTQSFNAPLREQIRATALNIFDEGKLEGKLEGKQEGINSTILTFMSNMPQFSDVQIAEFFNLPLARIKKLRKTLGTNKPAKNPTEKK